MLVDEVFMGA